MTKLFVVFIGSRLNFPPALIRTIVDERVVDVPFSSALYKFLLSEPIMMEDLEAYDDNMASGLRALLRSSNPEVFGWFCIDAL